jgi:hypothetical protein
LLAGGATLEAETGEGWVGGLASESG